MIFKNWKEHNFKPEDLKKFPCKDLEIINQLWKEKNPQQPVLVEPNGSGIYYWMTVNIVQIPTENIPQNQSKPFVNGITDIIINWDF
ncbi:hypothetical protein [Aphanothece sacrum]|uniref:DNA polymerase I n=1 Tax=Aphanothece sacrum FPU1 TaxID=1920663 RepID=A0A401ILW5_APHSA|nr:hypothetical protein [Aphanothece sacrum]GBF82231.1 DNA polymerase I [Aphanothece sacrum FPU1]GBF87231.1 DNA polymerase I [Aphanothece sacrum FPU3]